MLKELFMKTKRKFVNVVPRNSKSKNVFINDMDSLHGMEVKKETDSQYFVISINQRCSFWLNKKNDSYWNIEK